MDAVTFLLGGLILLAVGGWTVLHPNGGYRAAGGAGSGLDPGTRQIAGYAIGAIGTSLTLVGVVLTFARFT